MSILYLLSVVMILTTFILVKKSEKEIDIISFICISIVTLFCYNTFVCYILTFFMIPNTLLILSIINICVSLLFVLLIIRNKEIQRFSFKKIDIIYISIIAICVLTVSYINFGFPFSVNYESGDSATHYLSSVMFARSDYLLGAKIEKDAVHGTRGSFRPVAYANTGLLMKSICSDINFFECYNVFVCFEIFILFFIGISIYNMMKRFAKNKEHYFIAFLLSLFCMLGYPLNSLLFGFEYLTVGLLIICTIIELINYYNTESINIKFFIPIMALINFGLFLSYYMFVVFVYPAQWIYFCINNFGKTKKVITKQLIMILIITLLIPFILGYIYSIAPNLYTILIDKINNNIDETNILTNLNQAGQSSKRFLDTGIQQNGYAYINLYSNFLVLLPLCIYFFIKKLNNKRLKDESFLGLLILFTILFIEIFLIGNSLEKVSMYYISKNYYPLWIILFYCSYRALIILYEKENYLPRILVGSYVFMMIICTIFSNIKVEYRIANPYESVISVMEIYGANKDLLLNKEKEYNQKEIEILKVAYESLDNSFEFEIITDETAYYWQYVILEHLNKEDAQIKYNGQKKLAYKFQMLEESIQEVDYVIYFNKSKKYKQLEDKLFIDAEIIYENDAGGILKYNR